MCPKRIYCSKRFPLSSDSELFCGSVSLCLNRPAPSTCSTESFTTKLKQGQPAIFSEKVPLFWDLTPFSVIFSKSHKTFISNFWNAKPHNLHILFLNYVLPFPFAFYDLKIQNILIRLITLGLSSSLAQFLNTTSSSHLKSWKCKKKNSFSKIHDSLLGMAKFF